MQRDVCLCLRLAIALTAALLGAGCSRAQPVRTPVPPAPSASASSAAPQPSGYPQADLAEQPCRALGADELATLGIDAPGQVENSQNGPSCHYKVADQNVGIDLDVPQSFEESRIKDGRVSPVAVGRYMGVQAEYQRICFTFVAVGGPDHQAAATTIPDPGASQDTTCNAGAKVLAAAVAHIAV
ncbi:DUF3558 family protein [Dactylosporangium sp. NPDC051541]|uniref:DUF3558 family protein n=1 Tax=Dactylosporangium sp. NPDC051541 TaxID=3363977 RepID=UPI003789D1E2